MMTDLKGNLEAFTDAYIEAALWASNDDDGNPIDDNHGPQDLDPEALKAMKKDCCKFLLHNRDSIEADDSNDFGHAGHDFWLTRNGHGAGFWDGDWSEPYASQLDEASKSFGECYMYVENDTVYID